MIRGPVVPQLRERLWALVSSRLPQIESGLTLVLESLDCSEGQLGPVEGLARDAAGGPVLVLLAVDGDALLSARALSAGQFLQRVGGALVQAVPEAGFRVGVAGRVLVVGTDAAATALRQVCRLPVSGLAVCSLEPFRIAGGERFAVRWLSVAQAAVDGAAPGSAAGPAPSPHPPFVVAPAREPAWRLLSSVCERIDPGVQLHGDRYSRRITWNGHPLGEVRADGDALLAKAATGVHVDLRDARDVRRFGDQLLRVFVQVAGIGAGPDAALARDRLPRAGAAGARSAAPRAASLEADGLRAALASARLSPEEYSAFGAPVSATGCEAGGSFVAEDHDQSPAPHGAPPPAGRSD